MTRSQRQRPLARHVRALPLEDGPAELVLTLSPGPGGTFMVHGRTREDEDGVQGRFRLPWPEAELARLIGRLRGCGRHAYPVAAEGAGQSSPWDPRQTGRALFDALFAEPELQRLYEATRAGAGSRGFRLRLVLDPDQPGMAALHALPWELLFERNAGALLAVEDGVSVVRTLLVPRPAGSFEPARPLRVLALLSGARDLDLARERDALETVARQAGGLELAVEPATDLGGLEILLEAGHRGQPFHVLHLAGHGGIAAGPAGGVLVWEPAGGDRRQTAGRDLSQVLQRFQDLRLVVLNACSTAELPAGAGDPLTGAAAALLQGGVPVVAAVQGRIRDDAAILFARSFYRALAAGRTPEEAMAAARWVLWQAAPGELEWAKPVLFQGAARRRLPPWVLRAAAGLLVALAALSGLALWQGSALVERALARRVGEAEALLLDHRPGEAARVLEAALDRPAWPAVAREVVAAAHATAALAGEDVGDLRAAVDHAAEAARLDPGRAVHHYNLGVLLARSGRPGDAPVPLRRALELDPGLADARNELGCVFLDLGRAEEARRVLEAGLTSHPEHALLHKNLGRALLALGRPAEAAPRFERALELLPWSSWVLRAETQFWLARAAADRNDAPAACAAVARFRQADPEGVTEHAGDAARLAADAGCPSPAAILGGPRAP